MGSVVDAVSSTVGGVIGGVGSLAGGLLGGLGPKYADTDALQNVANQQLAGAQDAQAQLNALSTQRSDFGQALANQALGKAPSISEAQLRMAMDKNLQQQMAAAKSNRAVNPALAARMNVQQANQGAQATAQQSAINRLAEQQGAQQAFGNYLAQQQQAGAQYLSGAGQTQGGVVNAQAANNQSGTNMLSGLAQAGMGAALMFSDKDLKTLVKKYNKGGMVKPKKMAQGGQVNPMQFLQGGLKTMGKSGGPAIPDIVGGQAAVPNALADGENMQQMGMNFGQFLSSLGAQPVAPGPGMGISMGGTTPLAMAKGGQVVPGQAQVAGDSETNDTVPALLSPGEVVVPRTVVAKGSKAVAKFVAKAIKEKKGTTDKVQKKNEGGKVDEFSPRSFLDSLQAVSYNYNEKGKAAGAPGGRHLGIMAQDLEKAGPVGKSMVKETPAGKQVDFGVGFSAILASQAELNERLKIIESKWGKKNG